MGHTLIILLSLLNGLVTYGLIKDCYITQSNKYVINVGLDLANLNEWLLVH